MTAQKSKGKPATWKEQGRAWHSVTPPSAMNGVTLRIPALTDLIRNDAVPDRLRALALKAAAHPHGIRGVMLDTLQKENEEEAEGKDLEQAVADDSELKQAVEDLVEIQKYLISESVRVNGAFLTLEDLNDPEFPVLDAEFYGNVVLREVAYDARGVRLGIEPLDTWERFRDFHDCPAGCGSCAALQDEFSSVDLGVV